MATWGGENARGIVTGAIGKDPDWSPGEPSGLVMVVQGEGAGAKGPVTANIPVTDVLEAEDLGLGSYPKGYIPLRNLARKRGVQIHDVVGRGASREITRRLDQQRKLAREKRLAEWRHAAAEAARPGPAAPGPAIMPGEGRNVPTIEPGAAPETVTPKIEGGEPMPPAAPQEGAQQRIMAQVLRRQAQWASGADRTALLSEAEELERGTGGPRGRGSSVSSRTGRREYAIARARNTDLERIEADPWLRERRAEVEKWAEDVLEGVVPTANGGVLIFGEKEGAEVQRRLRWHARELKRLQIERQKRKFANPKADENFLVRIEDAQRTVDELQKALSRKALTKQQAAVLFELQRRFKEVWFLKPPWEDRYEFVTAAVKAGIDETLHRLGSWRSVTDPGTRKFVEQTAQRQGVPIGSLYIEGIGKYRGHRGLMPLTSPILDAARALQLSEGSAGMMSYDTAMGIVSRGELSTSGEVKILKQVLQNKNFQYLGELTIVGRDGKEQKLSDALSEGNRLLGAQIFREKTYEARGAYTLGVKRTADVALASRMLEDHVLLRLADPDATLLLDAEGKADRALMGRFTAIIDAALARNINPLAAVYQQDSELRPYIARAWLDARERYAQRADDVAMRHHEEIVQWLDEQYADPYRESRMGHVTVAFRKTYHFAQKRAASLKSRTRAGVGIPGLTTEDVQEKLFGELRAENTAWLQDNLPKMEGEQHAMEAILRDLDFDPKAGRIVAQPPIPRSPDVWPEWAGNKKRPGEQDRLADPAQTVPHIRVLQASRYATGGGRLPTVFSVPPLHQQVIDAYDRTALAEIADVAYELEHEPITAATARGWDLDYEPGVNYESPGSFQFEAGGRVRITIRLAPGKASAGQFAEDASIWPGPGTLLEEIYHAWYHLVRAGDPQLADAIDARIDGRLSDGLGAGYAAEIIEQLNALWAVPARDRTPNQNSEIHRLRGELDRVLPIYCRQMFAETMAAIDLGGMFGNRGSTLPEQGLGDWSGNVRPPMVDTVYRFIESFKMTTEVRAKLAQFAEQQGEQFEYAAAMRRPTPPQAKAPRVDIEERLREARGIETPTLMSRMQEAVMNMVHAVTRPQRYLPNDAEHAVVNEFFRMLKNVPLKVSDIASRNVGYVIEHLSSDDLVLLERLMIGRNMLEALAQGQPLRFGFQSEAEVRAWNQRVEVHLRGLGRPGHDLRAIPEQRSASGS